MKIYIPKYALLILMSFTATSNGQSIIDHLNENNSLVSNGVFDAKLVVNETEVISSPNAPSRMTRQIRKDKDGNLIFASFVDVIRHDGSSFTKLTKQDGLDSFDAFDVLVDRNGGTWVASTHFGVFHYPTSTEDKNGERTFNHFTTHNGLVGDRVMNLFEDRSGGIWIGTGSGVSYYDGKTKPNGQINFRNFTEKDGLTNRSVNTIMEDTSGHIWVGTRGTVSRYDPKYDSRDDSVTNLGLGEMRFKEIKDITGKPFENIWSIIEDSKGNIWLGGQFGLWRYDGNTYASLTSTSTQSVYEDKNGVVWFTHGSGSTHTAGLSYYDQDSLLTDIPKATQVVTGSVLWGINEDKNGGIWVGKLDGVMRYDGESVTYFKDE